MIRKALLGLSILALGSACDSGRVPSPADQQAGSAPTAQVDSDLVALHGEGIVAGAEAFYFAAGRSEVQSALAATLGEATRTEQQDECGAGPVVSSIYPGGLTVNFQSDSLAGWTLSEASETIVVDSDVAIGTARDEAEAAPGFAPMEGSTLGEEFMLGDELGGLIEDGAVSMLYAGTQCFFR